MKRQVTTTITHCARCGHNHPRMVFQRLKNHEKYTHWGMCPRLKQPILMTVTADDAKLTESMPAPPFCPAHLRAMVLKEAHGSHDVFKCAVKGCTFEDTRSSAPA